jgi:hypothetical protein
VTLQEIYRARCRTHAAFHASPRHDPKATGVKEIIRKIKTRLQQRIEYEHAKAENARRFSHEEGPMAARLPEALGHKRSGGLHQGRAKGATISKGLTYPHTQYNVTLF